MLRLHKHKFYPNNFCWKPYTHLRDISVYYQPLSINLNICMVPERYFLCSNIEHHDCFCYHHEIPYTSYTPLAKHRLKTWDANTIYPHISLLHHPSTFPKKNGKLTQKPAGNRVGFNLTPQRPAVGSGHPRGIIEWPFLLRQKAPGKNLEERL